MFQHFNNFNTTITADVLSGDTSVVLAALPSGAIAGESVMILIDSEFMLLVFPSSGLTCNVLRAQCGSAAVGHTSGATVKFSRVTRELMYALSSNQGLGGVRLSLSPTQAVPTADQTAQNTIYALPFNGAQLPVWMSASSTSLGYWKNTRVPASTSLQFSGAGYRYKWQLIDIFASDSADQLALSGLAWNYSTGAITAATNATPIVITSAGHGRSNGDVVIIEGVVGNTGANGTWSVSGVTTNTFTLDNSAGTGAWTSGGTWYKLNATRATALTLLDGVNVLSSDYTKRLLGTVVVTGDDGSFATFEDSAQNRLLGQAVCPVLRPWRLTTGGSNACNGASRYLSGDPACRITCVVPVAPSALSLALRGGVFPWAGDQAELSAVLNATTGPPYAGSPGQAVIAAAGGMVWGSDELVANLAAGFNFIPILEFGTTSRSQVGRAKLDGLLLC